MWWKIELIKLNPGEALSHSTKRIISLSCRFSSATLSRHLRTRLKAWFTSLFSCFNIPDNSNISCALPMHLDARKRLQGPGIAYHWLRLRKLWFRTNNFSMLQLHWISNLFIDMYVVLVSQTSLDPLDYMFQLQEPWKYSLSNTLICCVAHNFLDRFVLGPQFKRSFWSTNIYSIFMNIHRWLRKSLLALHRSFTPLVRLASSGQSSQFLIHQGALWPTI